jgi:hypothetical protein
VSQWSGNIEDFMTSIECELDALRNKKKKETLNKKDVEKVFPEGSFFRMTKGA